MTKERIREIIAERKAQKAKEERLQALREAREARNVRNDKLQALREARQNQAVRQPVQRTAKVLNERTYVKKQKTLAEAVDEKIKMLANGDEHVERTYRVLADNIVGSSQLGLGESVLEADKRLTEATQASSDVYGMGTRLGLGINQIKTYFDLFFGYFPDLITPRLASVQPLKTQNGVVHMFSVVAGNNAVGVAKGTTLISPFEINIDKDYVTNVAKLPKGTLSKTTVDDDTYTTTMVPWQPAIPRSLYIKGVDLTWSSDTAATGKLGQVNIAVAVTVSSSEYKVVVTGDAAVPSEIEMAYYYDNVFAPTMVPEIEGELVPYDVKATNKEVKTNYSFTAGYGFEQTFGFSFEEKISEAATYILKKTVDLEVVGKIMAAAPKTITWNASPANTGGLYPVHKMSLTDAFIKAANEIFNKSKRKRGNKVIVGTNVLSIVQSLDEFKENSKALEAEGGYYVGDLKGMEIIAVPELGADDFAVIYKSKKDDFDAGIVFAPFIPVVSTPSATLSDFLVHKAFMTSYDVRVINPNYFVRGKIINDSNKPIFTWS
ncbi:MAG TPA: hypothetical protein PKY72_03395 [Bacilli bacterium]|nr:hypothetical protein [Bacilli bacterium]